MSKNIYHICSRLVWEAARAVGVYASDTLDTEGFIHCSDREQVVPTANVLFAGQTGLVLLEIDPQRLSAELKYEDTVGARQDFPHVYGPLNVDAVIAVHDFPPGPDGSFTLPI